MKEMFSTDYMEALIHHEEGPFKEEMCLTTEMLYKKQNDESWPIFACSAVNFNFPEI